MYRYRYNGKYTLKILKYRNKFDVTTRDGSCKHLEKKHYRASNQFSFH